MTDYLLSDHDRSTLQYKVTTKLREVILTGHFEPGERLVQEEWASKLGVSRMPIREALHQLETEGLVKIEPRRGAIVTPISVSDIEEIYYLRALLEGEAVERSLPYLKEDDIEELEDIYNQMILLTDADKDVQSYVELNIHFHRIMRSGCQWRRIHQMIDTLWKGIPLYTPSLLSKHLTDAHKEHKLMLDYIKQNEPEKLKEIMRDHILRTRDKLIEMIKTERAGKAEE